MSRPEEEKIEYTLICHTSKYKLKEAEFFQNQLKDTSIWNDDEKFPFYLNAFVFSSGCVVDYVHADFIFNTIKPRIKWRDWENRDPKIRNRIIESHSQSNAIRNFLNYFKEQRNKLWDDPIVNYFLYKRNKITHIQWDSDKQATYTEKLDGSKNYDARYLEATYLLFLLESKPDYNLDLFYDKIPREVQIETIRRLSETSIDTILGEYVTKLRKFIELFDGRNFYSDEIKKL